MPSGGDLWCQYVMYIPGGAITLQGPYSEMLITGGIGCYSDISGFVFGGSDDDAGVFTYTFDIEQ